MAGTPIISAAHLALRRRRFTLGAAADRALVRESLRTSLEPRQREFPNIKNAESHVYSSLERKRALASRKQEKERERLLSLRLPLSPRVA
jgi:hypothetical protein